jgi:hypothetical protein
MSVSMREQRRGQPALDLLEEAFAVLRSQPVENLLLYLLGTTPFALSLIYFWADMSGGALAHEHLGKGSLALTLAWVWMKSWQAVFAERVKSSIMKAPPLSLTPIRLLRLAVFQGMSSAWALLLLPVAFVITLPAAWCLAFFQNLTVLDRGDDSAPAAQVRQAWQQARLWPGQNHQVLLMLSAFSLVVFINFFILLMLLPHLLKMLFGIESIYGMGALAMANSTLWLIVSVLTFLCVDPLAKTAYVLRCYRGLSLRSGEDLLAELHLSRKTRGIHTLFFGFLVFLALCGTPGISRAGRAQTPVNGRAQGMVVASELDRAIDAEMSRVEYSWRMPRDQIQETNEEPSGFMRTVAETIRYWGELLGDGIEAFFDWLGEVLSKLFPKIGLDKPEGRSEPADLRFLALYIGLGFAICIAAMVAWRHLRRRKGLGPEIVPADVLLPDIEAEEVDASVLPVNEWLALAEKLLEQGQRRLAVRALYLADLAGLAGADLLNIGKAKSDHDYCKELQRNILTETDVVQAFFQNIIVFQQIWYGMREVSEEMLEQFQGNHRRIMSHVGTA